jgi:hypothetical protein
MPGKLKKISRNFSFFLLYQIRIIMVNKIKKSTHRPERIEPAIP